MSCTHLHVIASSPFMVEHTRLDCGTTIAFSSSMDESTPLEKSLGITPEIEHSVYRLICFIGCLIFGFSLVVIYSWVTEIEILKRLLQDRVSMKMITVLGFSLLGLALICLANYKVGRRSIQLYWAGRIFAACTGLIGLMTIVKYLFSIDFGIDQLLITEEQIASGILPASMSPSSAICFTLLGLTFALQGTSKKNESVAQILCFITLLIAYGIIVGYLLKSPQLYGLERMNSMAIHTTIAFFMVSVAGIFLYHDHRYIAIVISPSPAGYISRRLLPIIFIGPIVFAWLRWTFISEDWLKGRLTTALFTAVAAGFTSTVANILAWKMHEQYSLKKESDTKIEEQNELIAWREKLVATLVHDLRTPLTSARIAAELFTRKQEYSHERIQDLGKRMTIAIDRSDRLLRDLLDSTRAMSGVLPNLVLTRCNLRITLEKALSLLPHQEDRLRLICPQNIDGMWNEDAIIRIIENLVSNALKYGAKEKIITIEVTSHDLEFVRIKVHNWGSFISKKEQQGLFDLFSRMSNVGYRPGWGIGLVVVKALTDSLGGEVFLKSSIEEGTEFVIELPTGMSSPHPSLSNLKK